MNGQRNVHSMKGDGRAEKRAGGRSAQRRREGAHLDNSDDIEDLVDERQSNIIGQSLTALRHDSDVVRKIFETGEYSYRGKVSRKAYEKHKAELQVELLKVQDWVRASGQKIDLLFEGRDDAGKGGTIKRFTEPLNPRGAGVVALDKPTEREQTEWFIQRYIRHLPAGGEIVSFDRS